MNKIIEKIKDNVLFKGLTTDEIQSCLDCSKAILKDYDKNQIVFSQMDPPKSLYVLIQGSVVVCKDSPDGRRFIVTNIEENDIFGEVFVFLKNAEYENYVVANAKSKILEIPKEYFFSSCSNSCKGHSFIIQNMLGILAQKAYYLNNRVQLLTSGTLRQKICRYLLENYQDGSVKLTMNREELAAFFNVARPSLSRELIQMQDEGLIIAEKNVIKVPDLKLLSLEL